MVTMTRARARAIEEATNLVGALASTIEELTEALADARERLSDLEERWAALGEQMYLAHEAATSPLSTRDVSRQAVERFRAREAERLALDEPRREAASRVIELQRRLLFLKSGRAEWHRRVDELEAGTVVPEEPLAAAVEPALDPDGPAGPVDLQRVSSAASAVPAGAPAPPERPRRWWGW